MKRAWMVHGAAVAIAILGGALALPSRVEAHALRQSSVPADRAILDKSPPVVVVTFGEEPDPRLSRIEVLDTSQRPHQKGALMPAPGDPRTLVMGVQTLPNGVYTVSWRTVSGVDGHAASGTFAFGVGVSAAEVASLGASGQMQSFSGESPPPSVLAIAGRWGLYAGLFILVGFGFAGAFVFRSPPRSTLLALPAGWLMAATATVVVVGAQAHDAGIRLPDLFATSIGRNLGDRAASLGVAAVAVALVRRLHGRALRWSMLGVGIGGALAMLVDVLLGHAGAESGALVNAPVEWIHIVAAGVWIGGLAALLLGVRGAPTAGKAEAVRRFSTTAAIALVAVAVSGIARAAVDVGGWDRLTSTRFGQLVLLKAALLGVLGALGALNRFRNVAAASTVLRGLRRVGSAELGVASLAVLIAAALVNIAPPATAAVGSSQAAPMVLTARGNDDATTVRVRLEMSPGVAGFNRFQVYVVDYDTQAPASADGVQLRFALARPGSIGESVLTLARQELGRYSATGSNLSLDGTWTVTVLIERGARSVEVPLRVTPRVPPEQVTVNRTAGEPTLYTIHLSQGRTVQTYLDPDRPGDGIFHATFFDAQGNELPVTQATISMTPPGRTSPTPLAVRPLEPGHFVANVRVSSGQHWFDITGTTNDGQMLSAHVDLTPGS